MHLFDLFIRTHDEVEKSTTKKELKSEFGLIEKESGSRSDGERSIVEEASTVELRVERVLRIVDGWRSRESGDRDCAPACQISGVAIKSEKRSLS